MLLNKSEIQVPSNANLEILKMCHKACSNNIKMRGVSTEGILKFSFLIGFT